MGRNENKNSEGSEKSWVSLLLERPVTVALLFLFVVVVCWFFGVKTPWFTIAEPKITPPPTNVMVVPNTPEKNIAAGQKKKKEKNLHFNITDSLTGEAIPDVEVLLVSNGLSKFSSKIGKVYFSLKESASNEEFRFTHDKYKTYRENYELKDLSYSIKLLKK